MGLRDKGQHSISRELTGSNAENSFDGSWIVNADLDVRFGAESRPFVEWPAFFENSDNGVYWFEAFRFADVMQHLDHSAIQFAK